MATFYFRLEQEERVLKEVQSTSTTDLRSKAVRFLGSYLAEHPDFALDGHWRLVVENEHHQSCMHVIVATVDDRNSPSLTFAERA